MEKKATTKKVLTTTKSNTKVAKKKPTAKKSVKKSGTKKNVVVKQLAKPTAKKTTKPTALPKTDLFILTDEEKNFLDQHRTLKLQIELVPTSCWYSNVRSNVKASQWDRIRRGSYSKANLHCEICGGQGTKHPVECHEVWIYEEETLTQRLGYFQAICPLCHEVKHIGLAGVRGNGERAANRFREVNNLEETTARKIKSAVFKQWRIRSNQSWKLEVELLKEHGIDISALFDKSKLKRQTSEDKQ